MARDDKSASVVLLYLQRATLKKSVRLRRRKRGGRCPAVVYYARKKYGVEFSRVGIWQVSETERRMQKSLSCYLAC